MNILLDVLLLVLARPELDQSTLFRCSLVSKAFNVAATKLLYRKVVLSPRFKLVLDLRERTSSPQYRFLQSSCLPHHAVHVSELEVSGYLSPRPPPRNPVGSLLVAAVRAYTHLRSVTLTPQTFHPNVFTDVLPLLKDAALRRLTVNAACTDASLAPILVEIQGLQELGLYDPTRAVLQLLPDWLERLSTTLVVLHLRGNCGSITPGVLRSFLPHTQHIRSFSLGISYSLTDEDVFTFLGQLPLLETVHLQYYLQLRSPAKILALPNLRSFTVRYERMQNRKDASRLCVWVRRAVARSPLEHLCMTCEHSNDSSSSPSGANVSFDSLFSHLAMKHFGTLRSLHMGSAFIGPDALRSLCKRCAGLEELSVSLGIHSLWVFKDLVLNMTRLHTARFILCNIKRSRLALEVHNAAEIIKKPLTPALRCLSVNDFQWEGSWVSVGTSNVEWVVRDVSPGTHINRALTLQTE